jgi:hypothetical protein
MSISNATKSRKLYLTRCLPSAHVVVLHDPPGGLLVEADRGLYTLAPSWRLRWRVESRDGTLRFPCFREAASYVVSEVRRGTA